MRSGNVEIILGIQYLVSNVGDDDRGLYFLQNLKDTTRVHKLVIATYE